MSNNYHGWWGNCKACGYRTSGYSKRGMELCIECSKDKDIVKALRKQISEGYKLVK